MADDSTDGLIKSALNERILERSVKAANCSTINTFKTGAIIFDRNFEVISWGCSHIPDGKPPTGKRSVHAEDHALDKIRHLENDFPNYSILVYTLSGKSGNVATSSRPCVGCSMRIADANLKHVYYLEQANDETWTLNRETPVNLVQRTWASSDLIKTN